MTHKIFNASNVLGAIVLFSLIACGGAAEGGMWLIAFALLVVCGICAYLLIKENGEMK